MENLWLNIDEWDVFEIYNHLPKINCRRCGESTCLAFAAKVENKTKKMKQCLLLCQNETEY